MGVGGVAWAEQKSAPPTQEASTVDEPPGEFAQPLLAPLVIGEATLRPTTKQIELKRGIFLSSFDGAVARPTHTSLLPVGPRGRKIPVQTVEVDNGRVAVEVPTTGILGVLLRGPDGLSAIVTQGRATLVVDSSKTHLVTFGHDVLLGKDGRFDTIPSGTVVRSARQTSAIGAPAALPNAPRLRATTSVAPVIGGPADVVIEAPSNTRPLIFGVFDEQGHQVGESMLAESSSAFTASLPGAGTYRVVARALDESGVGGPVSAPATVRVLGLGAELQRERGAFLMRPDQRVPLIGAQGLEMYHQSTRGFVPAPASLALIDGAKTDLLFRDPASPASTVALRLEPLTARARVSLSPGLAVWPEHPIAMSVKAHDVHGEPIVVGENFQVKVRVNFDEVEVDWETRDGSVHATLPPQSGPGPWVVRVSVIDEYGTEVGRNHLEVIRGRSIAHHHASR